MILLRHSGETFAAVGDSLLVNLEGFSRLRLFIKIQRSFASSVEQLTAVTVYVLRPGTGPDFVAAMKKVGDVLRKDPKWPKIAGWLQLVNCGEGPVFVLLSGRTDLAPLPKSAVGLTNEALGKEAADAVFKTIRDTPHASSQKPQDTEPI
jgi:hypothetical protein